MYCLTSFDVGTFKCTLSQGSTVNSVRESSQPVLWLLCDHVGHAAGAWLEAETVQR